MERAAVDGSTGIALLEGAIAGAVGVWAMDRVGWLLYEREDRTALARERAARPGGLDPAHLLVERVSGALGIDVERAQPNAAGTAVHYALGIVPGSLYALSRARGRASSPLHGLLFGLGAFVLIDEAASTVTRLAGPPRAYPWQAHARGLISHLVFGLVTDATLRALGRVRARAGARRAEAVSDGDIARAPAVDVVPGLAAM